MIICVDREPWFTVTGNGENPSIVIPDAMQHAMLLRWSGNHGAALPLSISACGSRHGSRVCKAALHAALRPGWQWRGGVLKATSAPAKKRPFQREQNSVAD